MPCRLTEDMNIEDGVCKLMDRSAFAGSIATADRLVRVAVKEAGIPLPDAVKMMTQTPARIMGLTQEQLATALNLSPQAISKWETGVSQT